MADVRRSLHGGPTQVNRRPAGFDRNEFTDGARAGVVDVQAHEGKANASAPLPPL
ncbi:unnamed protein product [[Actinomadura] parvosata subsp. kistnae]|nr:unnamed protein product [Actinomadura parvosata subsp. kistnae]